MFSTFKTSFCFASGLVALCASTLAYAGNSYSVDINKTEIVRLPAEASAVLIGNTDIADVSIHSSNIIFVVGRSYGETNLIVLDAHGQTMMDADIQVTNTLGRSSIRVHKIGEGRETYRCVPYCLGSPQLGDNPDFVTANTGQRQQINNDTASGALVRPQFQNFSIPTGATVTTRR